VSSFFGFGFRFTSPFSYLRKLLGIDGKRRRSRGAPPARKPGRRCFTFDHLETRLAPAIGVSFSAGTLTLFGTPSDDNVSVLASSTNVTVSVNNVLQTTVSSANYNNLTAINFNGNGHTVGDNLTVSGLAGSVAIGLTNVAGLAITSAANVTVTDTVALALGTSTLTGNLSVTANGAISQTGTVIDPGTTTLAAGAANNITLSTGTNAFVTVVITSGNNVTPPTPTPLSSVPRPFPGT